MVVFEEIRLLSELISFEESSHELTLLQSDLFQQTRLS